MIGAANRLQRVLQRTRFPAEVHDQHLVLPLVNDIQQLPPEYDKLPV